MTIEFTVPYPARKSAWTKRYGLNDDRRHYREKHSFFHDENYMKVVISDEQ